MVEPDGERTPTLLLSSAGDSRVTVTQSYKLFRALEDNGVETKLVVVRGDHLDDDAIRAAIGEAGYEAA